MAYRNSIWSYCQTATLIIAFFSLISVPTDGHSQSLTLSLSEAIQIALRENRTIEYYSIGREVAQRKIDYEKAIYIPSLSLAGLTSKYAWESLNLSNLHREELKTYQLSLSQKNALGGTSSVNFSTGKESYTYDYPRYLSKEYTSSLFLKYDQPVWKGFGPQITNLNIDKAKINKESALQKYEDMKSNILFNVFKNYFLFYRATEELRLKKEIRKNTEEIYNIVKEKVGMRRLPITDLHKMQATLFIQDKEILELENIRQQRKNQLMMSIYNDSRADLIQEVTLTDSPDDVSRKFKPPSLDETKFKAEKNDFELVQHKLNQKLFEKDLQKALNDRKPEFNLSLEVGYEGYNFNRWSKSINDLSTDNYRVILQGTLSLPLKNLAAESKAGEAKDLIRQTAIQINNRLNEIANIVNELFQDMEMVNRKKELNAKIVALSKENLANEIEKLVRDKSTVLNTLDYQTHFINAELDMLMTKVDHILLLGTAYLYRREIELFSEGLK